MYQDHQESGVTVVATAQDVAATEAATEADITVQLRAAATEAGTTVVRRDRIPQEKEAQADDISKKI
jgi:hypothetical protein